MKRVLVAYITRCTLHSTHNKKVNIIMRTPGSYKKKARGIAEVFGKTEEGTTSNLVPEKVYLT
jgi:hypothetical protein